MPRKTQDELEEEAQEKIEKKEEVEQPQSQQQGIVEVPINLELLNNKLNYLITKTDEILVRFNLLDQSKKN